MAAPDNKADWTGQQTPEGENNRRRNDVPLNEALQEYPPRDEEVRASPYARQLREGFSGLSFHPSIEPGFRDYHWERGRRRVRLSIIVAIIVVSIFAIKDMLAMPQEVWTWTSGIRLLVMLPSLLIALYGITRLPRRSSELSVAFGCVVCLYGLTGANAAALMLSHPLPYEGLMLGTFFLYYMLGMRLHMITPICLPLVPLYAFLAIQLDLPPDQVLIHVLYLAIANLVGTIGLYSAEYSARTAFLNSQVSRFRAEHDPLTLLYNRRALHDALNRLWRLAIRQRQSLAVLLIDVDHFKAYNDHYGHVAGDQCLQRVADALKASLNRPMDRVGRYGGEEFMAIAYPVSGAGVVDLANRVREAVELLDIPHAASPSGERITVSVGVTCVPPRPGLEPDKLIDLADKALYRAKTAGRNCVEICGPEPAPIRPGGQKVSAIRPTQPATPRP